MSITSDQVIEYFKAIAARLEDSYEILALDRVKYALQADPRIKAFLESDTTTELSIASAKFLDINSIRKSYIETLFKMVADPDSPKANVGLPGNMDLVARSLNAAPSLAEGATMAVQEHAAKLKRGEYNSRPQ